MKTNVYFVRHAESDISVKEDEIRPLSENGLAATKRVTKALLDKDITAVFSSPYKRTIDTINDFAQTIGLEILTDDGFKERRVGKWVEDFKAFSRNQWEDFDYKIEHGESLQEVQKRNIASLLHILEKYKGQNIVIGTHGTALSTIINYFDPRFGYDGFWGIVDKMPYMIRFTFDDMKLETTEVIDF